MTDTVSMKLVQKLRSAERELAEARELLTVLVRSVETYEQTVRREIRKELEEEMQQKLLMSQIQELIKTEMVPKTHRASA